MSYTDKDYYYAARIAYTDLNEAYEYLKAKNPGETGFSVWELQEVQKELYPDADLGPLDYVDENVKKTWRISGIRDTNDSTGFYGVVIDTGNREALVGCRGSEGMKNGDNLFDDWIINDFSIPSMVNRPQDDEIRAMIRQMESQGVWDDFDSISFTGHSLGGNLAESFAINMYEAGYKDKISSVVSLDGPGFSNEYYLLHKDAVDGLKDKVIEYKWSLVGGCGISLFPHAIRYPKILDGYNFFSRHNMKALDFDGDYLQPDGTKDIASYFTTGFTYTLDFVSTPFLSFFIIYNGYMLKALKHGISEVGTVLNEAGYFFSNLFDNIKRFFDSREVYFKVNREKLSDTSKKAQYALNRIRMDIDGMLSAISHLNGMWEGPSKKAFINKFENEKTQIENYLKTLSGYVNILDDDSKAYDRAEHRVLANVNEI